MAPASILSPKGVRRPSGPPLTGVKASRKPPPPDRPDSRRACASSLPCSRCGGPRSRPRRTGSRPLPESPSRAEWAPLPPSPRPWRRGAPARLAASPDHAPVAAGGCSRRSRPSTPGQSRARSPGPAGIRRSPACSRTSAGWRRRAGSAAEPRIPPTLETRENRRRQTRDRRCRRWQQEPSPRAGRPRGRGQPVRWREAHARWLLESISGLVSLVRSFLLVRVDLGNANRLRSKVCALGRC